MRFLLNAARHQRALLRKSNISKTVAITAKAKQSFFKKSKNEINVKSSSASPLQEQARQEQHQQENNQNEFFWGQKCSPNCGCVVRFDCETSSNNTVTMSSYQAKSVLFHSTHFHHNDDVNIKRQNQPLFTNHPKNPKPMFTPCSCETLHKLSSQVAQSLPGKTLAQLRNETCGLRTSDAFKYLVLRNMGLYPALREKNNGVIENNERVNKCYDLVEEAYLSMIRGHPIAPRKSASMSYSLEMNQKEIVSLALDSKALKKTIAESNIDDVRRKQDDVHDGENAMSSSHGYAPARRRMLSSIMKHNQIDNMQSHVYNWKKGPTHSGSAYRSRKKVIEDDSNWVKYVDEQYMLEEESSLQQRQQAHSA